jgi:serine/threonine protein kinase
MTIQEQPNGKPINSSKTDVLIGTQVGSYKVTRLLGVGGMSRVYEAYHQTLDRRVALKILSEEHGDDSELTQRFHREAKALAGLEHPHIVTLFEVGETERSYFIAMRYIDGQTLTTFLKKLSKQKSSRFMPFDQVFMVVADVAEALDYAHKQGVIHRDVKPSNIMLTEDGHAILTDFGLMMHAGEGSTLGTAFGTPRYIAPEQAVASQRAVPQSDLYSLGIVLYEMLTGETPFNQESAMSMALSHITNPPPPPRSIRPDLSPLVEQIILKTIEKKPEDRYFTGRAMVEALQKALDLPETAARSVNARRVSAPRTKSVSTSSKALIPVPIKPTSMIAIEKAIVSESSVSYHEDGGSTERLPVPSTQILTPVLRRSPFRRRLKLLVALLLPIILMSLIVVSAQAMIAINTPVIVAADVTDTPIPVRLRLVYAANWLAIYNPTGKPAALKGLILARGSQLVDTARMAGGSALDGLPAGQCVEIQLQGADNAVPFMCDSASTKFLYVASLVNRVWYDSTGAASTFSVRRSDQTVLQNCLTSLNTCEFEAP